MVLVVSNAQGIRSRYKFPLNLEGFGSTKGWVYVYGRRGNFRAVIA